MKRKKNSFFFSLSLSLSLSLLLLNLNSCTREEIEPQERLNVKTVEFSEALALFDSWTKPSDEQLRQMRVTSGSGSVSNGYIIPDLEEIRHEELINSEEFMTVIPTLVPDDSADVNSILLFRLNDKLETVLFSAYPDSNSTNDEFSGIFLVRTLDKHILRGFRFEGGYMTALLLPREDNGSSSVHRRNTVKRRYQVVDYDYDIYLDEFVVTANKPYSIYIPFLAESVYPDIYGGGGGDNLNDVHYSPGVTGGGGHSGKPKPEEEGKKLADLFKTEIEEAKEKYREMLEECIYNIIDNALRDKNMQFGSITHDPNIEGNINAVFTSFGNLKIKNPSTLNSMTLKHEWFHMYQHYIYGVDVWRELQGMAEFEQAVFYDIVVSGRGTSVSGGLQDYEDAYSSWLYGTDVEKEIDKYKDWIEKIKSDPNFLKTPQGKQEYNNWADLFGQYSSYNVSKGYSYADIAYTPSSLINLTNLIKSCK